MKVNILVGNEDCTSPAQDGAYLLAASICVWSYASHEELGPSTRDFCVLARKTAEVHERPSFEPKAETRLKKAVGLWTSAIFTTFPEQLLVHLPCLQVKFDQNLQNISFRQPSREEGFLLIERSLAPLRSVQRRYNIQRNKMRAWNSTVPQATRLKGIWTLPPGTQVLTREVAHYVLFQYQTCLH
eukprot:g5913.t1